MSTAYSPFIQTLYDQQSAIGRMGAGAHYSVMRAPIWRDLDLKPLPVPAMVDFAIIWDEDHDCRVMYIVHRMFFAGLLGAVRFLGERKGSLSVLLDPRANVELLSRRVETVATHPIHGDVWTVEVRTYERGDQSIIIAEDERVPTYLAHIVDLWDLGVKPVSSNAADLTGNFPLTSLNDDLMSRAVVDIGLGTRLTNALIVEGFQTVGQVAEKPYDALAKTPGIGRHGMRELVDALARHGIELR